MARSVPTPLQDVLRKLRTGDAVNKFFLELEALPFPEDDLRALMPELVAEWEVIAKLESVPWPWVALLEMTFAGFLAPTACLYPVNTIAIYPLTWPFLLHPGSTQTSGLLRLYQDAFDVLEGQVNQWRTRECTEWKRANADAASSTKNPYEGAVNMTMGSGSLEGEGKQAALRRNLGRSCAFAAEGSRFFAWLHQEGALNSSIVVELYERAKWKRTTLDGTRSFEIPYPFLAMSGAVHLEDIAFMFCEQDPLGLRGRAKFLYTRPSFKRAAELREANQEHNPRRTLLPDLVAKFLPIHRAHSLDHTPRDLFEFPKDYPLRAYTLHAEAVPLFDRTFDEHVGMQEQHYLTNHSLAKAHGKLKTANLRFGLQVHLREQARLRREPGDWSLVVTERALRFGDIFGQYLDKVSDRLGVFFHTLLGDNSGGGSGGGGAGTGVGAKMRDLLKTDIAALLQQSQPERVRLLRLVKVVLTQTSPWTLASQLRHVPACQEILANVPTEDWDNYFGRAGALLIYIRLGNAVMSINASGPKSLFLYRRPLLQDAMHVHFVNILHKLEVEVREYKPVTVEKLNKEKPRTAPEATFPPVFNPAEALAILQNLDKMRAAS